MACRSIHDPEPIEESGVFRGASYIGADRPEGQVFSSVMFEDVL